MKNVRRARPARPPAPSSAPAGRTTSSPLARPTETRVPSAAVISKARESTAPPTVSITMSASAPASRGSVTVSVAPRARRCAVLASERATAVTPDAPPREARRTARAPTAPVAPVTITRLPSTAPPTRSDRRAEIAAIGTVAAACRSTLCGTTARPAAGAATCCAHAPPMTRPATRVPTGGPEQSAASRDTTPASSWPSTVPGGAASRRARSVGFTPAACTSTSASCGAGLGAGTRSRWNRCGSDSSTTSASMVSMAGLRS